MRKAIPNKSANKSAKKSAKNSPVTLSSPFTFSMGHNPMNLSQAQKEILIAEIAKALPVVHEMRAVYMKWRRFYQEQGKSDAVGHKKASEIIRRDYPNFNAEAARKGF